MRFLKPRDWATVVFWLAFIFVIFGQAPVARAADSVAATQEWTPSATEYQFFTNAKPSMVRFGTHDGERWIVKPMIGKQQYCGVSSFSEDPAPNAFKVCETSVLMEPMASPDSEFVPAGYELAFNDEFSGTALNRDKWFTRYVYQNGYLDFLKDEVQRYRDNDNHVVHDGMLSLTARLTTTGTKIESGMIRSKWETYYGYYETRVKMPAGKGVFAAWWLNSGAFPGEQPFWSTEVDMFEWVINDHEDNPAGKIKQMVHSGLVLRNGNTSQWLYSDPARFSRSVGDYWSGYDFTKGFHTFGLLWEPGFMTLYVDGAILWKRTYAWEQSSLGRLAAPAHILANLAIGGEWAGRWGIDKTAFPQSLDIDHIRVYKPKPAGVAP